MQDDLFSGRWARDAALAQVEAAAETWFTQAMAALRGMGAAVNHVEVTGEDIRHWITKRIGPPHHHNTFGALVMQAVRARVIEPTGRYVHMRDERSHARRTPIYRWVR